MNMNLLIKWNPLSATPCAPFEELADFERGLARFFGNAVRRGEMLALSPEPALTFCPATEVNKSEFR